MPQTPLAATEACVFDAYGTLFDVAAAAAHKRDALGDKAAALSEIWRQKQLQYTWLRTLMGAYVDFWTLTGDALDYGLEALAIDKPGLRDELMALYRELDAYAEVPTVLKRLKDAGKRTAILSNGSPDMLAAAAKSAGIAGLLDAVISVDSIGIYKPDARVYQLAVDRLGVPAGAISFQSSNAWDVAGSAHFGFRVVWVNRFGQPPERLPGQADAELTSLDGLPDLVGA